MARLIIFIFIMTLVSCGGAEEDVKTNKDSSSAKTESTNDKKQKGKKIKGKRKEGRKGKGRGRFGRDKGDDEVVIINVEAEKVFQGNAISVFKTTTILEADLESAVTSKASGIVLKINFEVGDKIKEGDVLAILESDPQRLRHKSALANYQKSLNNYERAKVLLTKGLANRESVDNLKFETQSLKTNLEQTKLELDYTKIKSPISGIVTKRNIKKGNLIQVNTEVYEVVDFNSLQAVINVPESKWNKFDNNLKAEIEFDSQPEKVTGYIQRMDPIVDSSTGTFKVVVVLDDTTEKSNKRLRPGLFGKIKVILDSRENTMLLSKNGLVHEDQKSYVYQIQKDNKILKKQVDVGYEMDDHIEILSGLELDDQVVTTGKNNLSEDSLVAVINQND